MIRNNFRFGRPWHPFYEGDGGGAGGSGADDKNKGGTDPSKEGGESKPEIDYDKLADIVAGKQKVTEDAVLKGYFKNLGLSKEDADKAIEDFKAKKAAEKPDVDKLNKDLADANASALAARIETEAFKLAETIGISTKAMSYVYKMADLKDVVAEGKIDTDKLKKALEQVLEDIPEFKPSKEEKNKGVKIGSDGDDPDAKDAKDERLRRAMGLKPKKED